MQVMPDCQNPVIAEIDVLEAMQAPVDVSAACVGFFTRVSKRFLTWSGCQNLIQLSAKPLPQKYKEITRNNNIFGLRLNGLESDLKW